MQRQGGVTVGQAEDVAETVSHSPQATTPVQVLVPITDLTPTPLSKSSDDPTTVNDGGSGMPAPNATLPTPTLPEEIDGTHVDASANTNSNLNGQDQGESVGIGNGDDGLIDRYPLSSSNGVDGSSGSRHGTDVGGDAIADNTAADTETGNAGNRVGQNNNSNNGRLEDDGYADDDGMDVDFGMMESGGEWFDGESESRAGSAQEGGNTPRDFDFSFDGGYAGDNFNETYDDDLSTGSGDLTPEPQ